MACVRVRRVCSFLSMPEQAFRVGVHSAQNNRVNAPRSPLCQSGDKLIQVGF